MTTTTSGHAHTDSAIRERAELLRALGAFIEPPGPSQHRLADLLGLGSPSGEEWTEAFVVQLVPHAAIYLGHEGMLGGEAADRVAGFWRALEVAGAGEPDHLSALLGLYAALVDAELDEPDGRGRSLRRHARAALLHEHVASWVIAYTRAMEQSGPDPYAGWATLVRQALTAEVGEVGAATELPLHLRDVPDLDAEGSLADMVDGLLVPARSGVVLTRAQLTAVARRSGVGLRLGDRRRVLASLIEQDPEAVLDALAGVAQTWQEWHQSDLAITGAAGRHWHERATRTKEILLAARDSASLPPSEDAPAATAHGTED